jgi:DNA-directed RNA polymerase beta subunit
MIKESAEGLTPILMPPDKRRELTRNAALKGVESIFPIIGTHKEIHVNNTRVLPKNHGYDAHKKALMTGGSLVEPLVADVTIKDKKTGKILDRKKRHTLLQLPYATENHTFVVKGNEYMVKHQLRTKPGVYTRRRGNDDIESSFNLAKGQNFRMSMNPEKGHLYMEYGTSKIPAYPILRGMGMQHSDISKKWGTALADRNRDSFDSKRDDHINKLYTKVIRGNKQVHTNTSDKIGAILSEYDRTEIDPETTKKTIGASHTKVGPNLLLQAGGKILDVYNGRAEEDERDSLQFQKVVSPEDFIQERLEKKRHELSFKYRNKADLIKDNSVDRILPAGSLSKTLTSFITNSQISQLPTQINPVEMLDSIQAITRVGEGGISDSRAVPDSVRSIHPSTFGVMDPYKTPDSGAIGVESRLSIAAHKDSKGNLFMPLTDLKTNKTIYMQASKMPDNVIAFPNQETSKGRVDVIKNGKVTKVKPKDVRYQIPSPAKMYSVATNMVPFLDSTQGNRIMMGGKYSTQSLPLVDREAPLVVSENPDGPSTSMEFEVANSFLPKAGVSGTVTKVNKDAITIRSNDGSTVTRSLANNFPLASKTMLHHTPSVKVGDKVTRNSRLADSNFTKNGDLALGKNLKIGYVAYHGLNSNDAVVISEAAAKKMTSETLVKKVIPLDSDTQLNQKKHGANFPKVFNKDQYSNLTDGLIKPGTIVKPGDPLATVLRKSEPSRENQMFGRIHKSLRRQYSDDSLAWDKEAEGEVVDVVKSPKQVVITVKAKSPLKLGDKVSNRYGGKGVVSKILKDDEMLKDEAGKPLDMLWTSVGVVSRINPGQVVETALAKVAEKTGKQIKVPSFQKVNNVKFARDMLKKHGIKDKETLTDPVSGKKIPNIMVGPQYTYKLFKSTDTNFAARGIDGGYDLHQQPAKGGVTGAKGTGIMEINALLAHDARDIIKENATIKSSRNSEFWRAVQLNRPVKRPEASFVFDKFKGMLAGAGIKYKREQNQVSLAPLTDKEVLSMSNGEIKNGKMVKAKDLSAEAGGLFDTKVTGGTTGNKWGHIKLPEPVLNPVFKDATRRILGMSGTQLDNTLKLEGGAKVKSMLNSIDVKAESTKIKRQIGKLSGSSLDNAIKTVKALDGLAKNNLKAGDAYTIKNLPVLPPTMRPLVAGKTGDLLISDVNHLYKDTLLAVDKLKEVKDLGLPDEDLQDMRSHLSQAVGAVIGMNEPVSENLKQSSTKGIINTISGTKTGYYNGKLYARKLNLTGRGTVAPDPSLGMDEIGMPEEMAWGMYQPFITKNLVKRGFSAVSAKQAVEDRAVSARNALLEETKIRPVIVNRAPTLHKHGLVTAFPKLVTGKTIQVNPFMEKGMGMDYDGDTLQVHLPATDRGIKDSKKMLLSNNTFGDRSRDTLLAKPEMESVAGIHMALTTRKSSKPTVTFGNRRDALSAYRRGEISLGQNIVVRD